MEDHGSHTGIKFEVCFFLGHSWLVEINDVKFFLCVLAICPSKDYNFTFIRFHAKPCPRESSYLGCISYHDRLPTILLWLVSFNNLFSENWEVCLFSFTWAADATKDINRIANCDHGKIWTSMLHWSTLYPRRLSNCRISLRIYLFLIWLEVRSEVQNFCGI